MKVSEECSHKCACFCVYSMWAMKNWPICACYTIVLGKHTNNLQHVLVKLTVYILRRENVSAY